MKKENFSIFSLRLSDFDIPTLAFLSIFTYQYLFPQYFFNILYALEIPSISIGLCIVFALIGWKTENIKYVKKEIICFFIIGIMFFSARFFVDRPLITKTIFSSHLHMVAIGLTFIFKFQSIRKVHLFTVLLILYASFAAFIAIREGGLIWGHDFLQDENQISAYMVMAIPLAFFYSNYIKIKFIKIICYICMALMVFLIIRSFSRGGLVALVSITFLIFLYSPKKILSATIIIIGVMLIISFAPQKFFDEAKTLEQGTQESTASARIELWRRAWQMFKENPILGKGIQQFPVLSHRYALSGKNIGERSNYLVCHSNWFQILSELGLLGAICYLTIFFNCLKSWRIIIKTPQRKALSHFSDDEYRFYRNLSNGLGIGIIGYMVAGTFINILTFPFFYTFSFFMMCVKSNWLRRLESNG